MQNAERSLSIWLITVGEPLPLPGNMARPWRTGLLARLLVARGHRVTWWTSTVDHFTKNFLFEQSTRVNVNPGLVLQFLHGRLYKRNVSLARWLNHREIAAEFERLSSSELGPDVILCSYPTIELSGAAAKYGKRRGIPVLLDIRDLWPDEMAALLPRLVRPLARLLLWPLYRGARHALTNAFGLVAISEAYLAWGLQHIPRARSSQDGVFTHGYPTQAREIIDGGASDWCRQVGIDQSKRIFWFIGTFVGSIDLGTVIEAAKLLTERKDALFVLSGSGQQDVAWRAQAEGLPNVVFTGWLNQDRLAAVAATAWVGLGAYKKDALMSLTNKIFEYMAHGLPVLISLQGEAKQLVENSRCGMFYEPGSPSSLASAVVALCDDPLRRDMMAEQAEAVFLQDYSSEIIYGRLAAHLEALTARRLGLPSQRKKEGH